MGKLDTLDLFEPQDREAWGRWLEENHATSPGVWLAVRKKHGRHAGPFYAEAVEEALRFGWIDGTVRRLDEDRFRQLFTPRRPQSTWSASNKQRVERLLAQGRMEPAGMAAVETARANGSWDALTDAEALVVPPDLAAALQSSPGIARQFEAIAESRRAAILYWISAARRPETREARIAASLAALAEGRSPI